ncbi:sulfatase-like hydrolase/transferase [Actinopolymorpha alba]|uniref:sulfatase-like hydrolase/transferase n=1 Tax=Actinopolymorpha alba TaxID=533267 RepID=UPI0003687119|nr:sulfatase-like hydrolase/transferase [Actinopolymorpha alba]
MLVLVDDLGVGDLAAYDGRLIRTPEIDRLARKGTICDAMYAAAATDTPSRAGILVGRYGARYRLPASHRPNLPPSENFMLPGSAQTIASLLKPAGYSTALFGQWRLGDRPGSLPQDHGFDHFGGTLYGTDVSPLAWYKQGSIAEENFDPAFAAARITDEAIQFLHNQDRRTPFLLILAHLGVHAPFSPEVAFRGRSAAGKYGDVVESIDYHLRRLTAKLANDTLIVLTSDNGPYYEGSNQGRRGKKPELMDGGVRVPFIASWQGRGRWRRDPTPRSLLDIVPSFLELADVQPPNDLDGESMASMLAGGEPTPRGPVYLFFNRWLNAVRSDRWKLHYAYGNDVRRRLPALYDVSIDTRESCSLTEFQPEVASDLASRIEALRADVSAEAGLSTPTTTDR